MLEDHRIGDHAVLPTVCAQSWMVDAAALALNIDARKYTVSLSGYRLFKGVIFDGTEPDALIIDTIDANNNASGDELSVSVKVSSIKADGKPQFHYGCDIAFTEKTVSSSDVVVPVSMKTATNNQACYNNGTLFHNDSLQGITAFQTSKENAWFRCQLPKSVQSKASGFDLTQASSNVFANDLVYQAMLVWVREEIGLGSLPSTTQAWEFIQAPSLTDTFYIQLSHIAVQGNSIKSTAVMLDDDGTVLARLNDCEVTASESLKDTFKRSSVAGQS